MVSPEHPRYASRRNFWMMDACRGPKGALYTTNERRDLHLRFLAVISHVCAPYSLRWETEGLQCVYLRGKLEKILVGMGDFGSIWRQ